MLEAGSLAGGIGQLAGPGRTGTSGLTPGQAPAPSAAVLPASREEPGAPAAASPLPFTSPPSPEADLAPELPHAMCTIANAKPQAGNAPKRGEIEGFILELVERATMESS